MYVGNEAGGYVIINQTRALLPIHQEKKPVSILILTKAGCSIPLIISIIFTPTLRAVLRSIIFGCARGI